jgi:hypothetical protein
MKLTLFALTLSGSLFAAEPVKLNLVDFTDLKGQPATGGWGTDADGVIHLNGGAGGNIISKNEYENFELQWEWKLASGGNNGIKYWVAPLGEKKEWLGIEYQMIDDLKHPDGLKGGSHTTGSIYDIKEPAADKPLKPIGEWNTSKIIVKDGKIEHWLNGKKVSDADTKSEDWKERIAKSKFKSKVGFAPGKGRIMLTDHQDETWFRNIQITPQ